MRTRLYIVTSGMKIDVFGDPVGNSLILNRPLREWQQQTAIRAGLDPVFVTSTSDLEPPYFLTDENIFFTFRFLSEFASQARMRDTNCIAGVASNILQNSVASAHSVLKVTGGYCYDLRYVVDREARDELPVLLNQDDLQYSTIAFPKAIRKDRTIVYCASTKSIVPILSPLHVLQSNMHQNLECAAERLQLNSADTKNNEIGRGCSIHPTAYLEGCKVGDAVSIGAYAVIRQSWIGDNVRIADSVNMFRSVIGANSMICEQHRVMMSVIYPECFLISGALQFSIIGSESAIFAAWITDARMDGGAIKTVISGKVVDSGMPFLGIIMGHRSKITAGVVTAPGRIVPNDTVVHFDPDLTYRGLPQNHPPGQPYYVSRNKL